MNVEKNQIGSSVGVIFPKEVLPETANGVTLTPYDPDLEEQLKLGREFMHDYNDTFHQLAK